MSQLDPLEFILQTDVFDDLLPTVGKEQWQDLYVSDDEDPQRFGLSCALLDDGAAARALESDSWDLLIGDGRPGFSQTFGGGETQTTYHRFGSRDGARPLVLHRFFHGAFPKYCELDEEFRLYHDLAEDKPSGRLLTFDSSGREIEVARVSPREVRVRLKHLRQFQAGTGLHVAIYVDSVRFSRLTLDQIPDAELRKTFQDQRTRWVRNVATCDFKDDYETFSRLLGKVVLPPPPIERAGIWPFENDHDDREVSFIIGVDENGDPVEHTSNPETLSNYFGANPGAPNYLTPVFFRREVLTKYFSESDRYTVTDGHLSCLGLWSCQIDNNLASGVAVFLGDLGRDLPFEERLHWRQFNVPPEGGISETNFRRSFLAQFTEAEAPDLVFRKEYAGLARDWERTHGWPLFLPLREGDAHLLDTVRVPVTNSQGEMDEQVLHVTKLLVDSLNEKEIAKHAGKLEEGTKGIGKLSRFFEAANFAHGDSIIQFLRDLQSLRSAGSGHRKGSEYDKIVIRLGLDLTRKPEAVARILEEATGALRAIHVHFLPT